MMYASTLSPRVEPVMTLNVNQLEYKRRILVVDDEPYNIMAVKLIMQTACDENVQKHLEYLIDEAENGKVAIEKVR